MVRYHKLKIKEVVVHVGPFQLLEQWKVLMLYKSLCFSYQSNSWLIVRETMETRVAMVVYMTMHLTMLTMMPQKQNKNIHIQPMMDTAKLKPTWER